MPIFNEDEILNATHSGKSPETEEAPPTEDTGFLDAVGAFYKMEDPTYNLISAVGTYRTRKDSEFDVNFKPIERLQETRPDLLDDAESFIGVWNEEDFNARVTQVERERTQRDLFAKAPTVTKIAAGLTASLVDPLILIPFVGIAKKASTLHKIGRGIAVGVGVGAGASTVREGILQGTQLTRTAEESMINIVAETALGGVLGGAIGGLTKPVRGATQNYLKTSLAGEDIKINVDSKGVPTVEPSSVGAAETPSQLDALGLAHINETLAKVVSGPEALRPPDLRAILSPSETVRKLGEVFYNSSYIRNKNIDGLTGGPRAQNAIFRRDQRDIIRIKEVEDLYLNYTGKGIIGSTLARPKGIISQTEFGTRIWKSLVDETKIDSIPQVNKAAKALRQDMNKVAQELQAAKFLPEDLDPTFMRNYMTRIYDLDKLRNPATALRFIRKVGNWIKTHNKDGSVRRTPLRTDEAEDIATDSLDKIKGETDQQISMSSIIEGVVTKGKFLKARQLLIPDAEIAEFIETDALLLYKNYMAKTSRLLETNKSMARAGFKDFASVIHGIKFDASKAVRGLDNEVEAAKIGKKFDKEERLATMMYRSMLGQIRKPGGGDRFVETLLHYQFVRLLGGVTISSFPEAVMSPFRLGFLKTLRDGYVPMFRSLKTSRLAKDQLDDLTGALEFEQANVLRSLGGIDDIETLGRSNNRWDTAQQLITKTFVKASGIGYWTSLHRRIAAQVASADLVRTLKVGPKGKDVERLAAMGVSKSDYPKLLAQIEGHVQSHEGTFVINPHLWKDADALELFQSAVQTEIESAILKPGVESLPFFVQQHKWAKVLFQFKSFMSAATGKITISAIQRKDATVLMGLMGLIALGSLSDMTHDLVAGREISSDPEDLLLSGISRSGILGLVGTTVLDVSSTFYSEKTRRFGGKFLASSILGPSAGQLEELTRAVQGLVDGDVSDKEIKSSLRMIPFLNLFYIKALTERVFDKE